MPKKTKPTPKLTAKRQPKPKAKPKRPDAESHIDGCDIDFATGELTSDVDLPAASGGVELAPRSRRRK